MTSLHVGLHARPRFLASVQSAHEAWDASEGGADVIDCKDARQGALGALPLATIRSIVGVIGGRLPVSATIGDLVPVPDRICAAATSVALTGVDYVKIGVFDGGEPMAAIAALGRTNLGRTRLVGLLLADRQPDFALIDDMARAGFAGVMLDTASKGQGALTDVMDRLRLGQFIGKARGAGLFVGLAGALRAGDIAELASLRPDILGFRGALCAGHDRGGALERQAVLAVSRHLREIAGPPADPAIVIEAQP